MASKPAPQNPIVRRASPGVFDVVGREGDLYTVRRGIGCSCQAGRFGRRCWHLAAVKAFVVAEQAAQVQFIEWAGVAA